MVSEDDDDQLDEAHGGGKDEHQKCCWSKPQGLSLAEMGKLAGTVKAVTRTLRNTASATSSRASKASSGERTGITSVFKKICLAVAVDVSSIPIPIWLYPVILLLASVVFLLEPSLRASLRQRMICCLGRSLFGTRWPSQLVRH